MKHPIEVQLAGRIAGMLWRLTTSRMRCVLRKCIGWANRSWPDDSEASLYEMVVRSVVSSYMPRTRVAVMKESINQASSALAYDERWAYREHHVVERFRKGLHLEASQTSDLWRRSLQV